MGAFELKGQSKIYEEVMPAQFSRSVMILDCVSVGVDRCGEYIGRECVCV